MIGARRYKEDDFEMISLWWEKHGLLAPLKDMYPEHGFVVENVAAAFLYKTDSAISLIEMVAYNPDAPKDIRQKALDEVIEAVIMTAKGMGFKTLSGFTDLQVVVERAKKFGFEAYPNETMVTLNLEGVE